MPAVFRAIGALEFANVNLPVGILIWIMIIPMLIRIDFGALGQVREHMRGIGVTLVVNWLVKPFSMALLAWLFIRHLFAPLLPVEQIDSYVAGLILLAAAPCTAMVFVWSRLTNGDPYFTLSQVALNDLIMVFAFAPLVALLLGVSSITVPWATLLTSVGLYIVIPVLLAQYLRRLLLARDAAYPAVVDWCAAGYTGIAVCVSGERNSASAAGDRPARGAYSDSGHFQFSTGLLAQSPPGRKTRRGLPLRTDWRV